MLIFRGGIFLGCAPGPQEPELASLGIPNLTLTQEPQWNPAVLETRIPKYSMGLGSPPIYGQLERELPHP